MLLPPITAISKKYILILLTLFYNLQKQLYSNYYFFTIENKKIFIFYEICDRIDYRGKSEWLNYTHPQAVHLVEK